MRPRDYFVYAPLLVDLGLCMGVLWCMRSRLGDARSIEISLEWVASVLKNLRSMGSQPKWVIGYIRGGRWLSLHLRMGSLSPRFNEEVKSQDHTLQDKLDMLSWDKPHRRWNGFAKIILVQNH